MRALLIPADQNATANAVGAVLDPDTGGAQSWRVGVSASGQALATHYVASYPFSGAVVALLTNPDAAPMHAALTQFAAARGRDYPLSLPELQALRDGMQIYDGPLPDAMSAWGLQFVNEDEQ